MRRQHWMTAFVAILISTTVTHAENLAERQQNKKSSEDGGKAKLQSQKALHVVQQDVAIAEILQVLKRDAPRGVLAFRNVRIIDPIAESVTPGQTVAVSGDRIIWVGDRDKEPADIHDAKKIDRPDLYIVPGLADMHVHSSSAASWLLDLSNGITTVRDMAGFPWMLRAREKIRSGKMLAPSLAVAGPLINSFGLEGYAVPVTDPLDARRTVRQQSACGYDFIKVWNVLPEPVFDAVAEQARLLGMDLVGHVPQDITVPHARAMGMRTMEHLKGFINDRTLQIGETDYVSAAANDLWNTPTLCAGRAQALGDEARSLLNRAEMKYVPVGKRMAWEQLLAKPEEPVDRLRSNARLIAKDIVRQLYTVHAHFLAGTDSDGYPFQVSGFALLDELDLLHDAGLSPGDAIRSATIEAARSMREAEEFGQIRKGFRADFIVLNANPINDLSVFRHNQGVMVHGFWLERNRLDLALARLAEVSAERDEDIEFSERSLRSAIDSAQRLSNSGFVLSSSALVTLAGEIRNTGDSRDADELEKLADVPTTGPCAEERPE